MISCPVSNEATYLVDLGCGHKFAEVHVLDGPQTTADNPSDIWQVIDPIWDHFASCASTSKPSASVVRRYTKAICFIRSILDEEGPMTPMRSG